MINLLIKVLRRLQRLRHKIMSLLIRHQFSSCGRRFVLRNPRSIVGGKYIKIGDDFDCFPGLRLEAFDRHLSYKYTPKLIIGNRVSLNYDCHIGCVNYISIGDDVLIASGVYISDHAHGLTDYSDIESPPSFREVTSKGSVIIDDNVWIGEGACVLPGVHIGRNSIIGANAVVSRNVPPYTIVGGVPARPIKTLIF